MQDTSSQYLTLPVAAFRLGRSYGQAHNLLLSGILVGRRVGNRWEVATSAVEAFLASQREREGGE